MAEKLDISWLAQAQPVYDINKETIKKIVKDLKLNVSDKQIDEAVKSVKSPMTVTSEKINQALEEEGLLPYAGMLAEVGFNILEFKNGSYDVKKLHIFADKLKEIGEKALANIRDSYGNIDSYKKDNPQAPDIITADSAYYALKKINEYMRKECEATGKKYEPVVILDISDRNSQYNVRPYFPKSELGISDEKGEEITPTITTTTTKIDTPNTTTTKTPVVKTPATQPDTQKVTPPAIPPEKPQQPISDIGLQTLPTELRDIYLKGILQKSQGEVEPPPSGIPQLIYKKGTKPSDVDWGGATGLKFLGALGSGLLSGGLKGMGDIIKQKYDVWKWKQDFKDKVLPAIKEVYSEEELRSGLPVDVAQSIRINDIQTAKAMAREYEMLKKQQNLNKEMLKYRDELQKNLLAYQHRLELAMRNAIAKIQEEKEKRAMQNQLNLLKQANFLGTVLSETDWAQLVQQQGLNVNNLPE